jgi:toxin ParE1/3/4
MARLVYSSTAKADLVDIAAYIADATGSVEPAASYIAKLRAKCGELASLPFPVGRLRPEYGHDLRSYAFGNHVLFFRNVGANFIVVAVVDGHRDISAFFAAASH